MSSNFAARMMVAIKCLALMEGEVYPYATFEVVIAQTVGRALILDTLEILIGSGSADIFWKSGTLVILIKRRAFLS